MEAKDAEQPDLETPREVSVLEALFNRAKATDEFEYICALLRIRGLEDAGWDPLEESQRAVNDYLALIEAPLREDTRLRLALLVYSHILETDAVYEVIENMLSIMQGTRCSISPLAHLYEKRRRNFLQPVRPPSAKKVVTYLKEHAKRNGEDKLANLLDEMFNEEIRNAFFHSDYVIYKDEFRIRHGGFKSVKISELEKIINNVMRFFQSFFFVWTRHRLSYKQPKVLRGRIGPNDTFEDIELLVHPTGGVYGFQSPRKGEEGTAD
jgi:hypothetical protein